MSQELNRNFSALKEKADPPPYFLSYEITEQEFQIGDRDARHRGFHHRRQEPRAGRLGPRRHRRSSTTTTGCAATAGSSPPARSSSFEDNVNSIKRRLWLETDRAYRTAAERLIRIKTNTQVKVAEEDDSDDFSTEAPCHISCRPRAKLKFTEARVAGQDPHATRRASRTIRAC